MRSGSIAHQKESGSPEAISRSVLKLFDAAWHARAIVRLLSGQMVRIALGTDVELEGMRL